MDAGVPGMAMSLVQSTYIIERYIHNPYIADYQFKVIYRCKPTKTDGRLGADELLDSLGDWATGQKPDIGDGLEVQEFEQTTRSSLYAILGDGWEDHQIFMRMTYMVNPGK
ncbi:MAG: minor capsid protein [Caudoviricetes sp.]|nr:MAG: minor capsid protein [Caudoviricetes sp.]